ncbi:MAG: VOC family protein [Alphaproteobacteria bacterium]|nr:VOC family protein [Alphaproteobacteria bacterium]
MTKFRQLPVSGEIFLDHSGHFVPDMDAASAALERMGFIMTPYTMHTMTTAPGEDLRPSGTANRCIMLREGYLEILCAVGDAPLAQQLNAAVSRYTGLHLLAFSCANAMAEHTRLSNVGFDMQPLVNLTRSVDEGILRFSVVRLKPGQMAEGRTQFLQHDTPDLLWREELMNHPNRIVATADVVMTAADPDEAAQRFERFLGRAPHVIAGNGWRFELDRASFSILNNTALSDALPGIDIPDSPFIAAFAMRSEDLTATMAYFDKAEIAYEKLSSGVLRVAKDPALGSTMIVTDAASRAPWLP